MTSFQREREKRKELRECLIEEESERVTAVVVVGPEGDNSVARMTEMAQQDKPKDDKRTHLIGYHLISTER